MQEKQTEKCKKELEAAQIQTEAGRLVEQCPTRTKFWILSSTTNTVFQSPDFLWIESSCVPDTTFTCKPVLLQLLDVWQGVHFEPEHYINRMVSPVNQTTTIASENTQECSIFYACFCTINGRTSRLQSSQLILNLIQNP